MLILPLKPAVRFDIRTALSIWLESDMEVSFEPRNPLEFVVPKPDFRSAACMDDLLRLQSLRNCLSDALLKPGSHRAALEDNALEDCEEYHAALLEFEKRGFPTYDDSCNGLALKWKSAFVPSDEERHATLIWDRSATLYNIAALLIFKASECSVTDRAACKEAVSYYQRAATVLNILNELVESQEFATVDLSQPMLSFWQSYCVASAQISIYRMASLAGDDSKHGTLSVLARSANELFNEALQKAQDARLESELEECTKNDWAPYCKAVSMLSAARAEYHQAVVHRLASEWGFEIARLRACLTKLDACRTFLKNVDADGVTGYTKRECLAIYPVVRDRLTEIEEDNYRIYHQEIPKTVDEIVGKQLARVSTAMPESLLIPKKPLFVNVR